MYEIVSGYAAPTIVAALVAVAVFHIVGKSALECLLPKADADILVHAPLLLLFFSQLLGMAVALLLLLAIAIFDWFYPWVIACAVFGLASLRLIPMRRPLAIRAGDEAGFGVLPWEWSALCAATLMVTLQAWRFPSGWDDTSFHLPLARAIVEHHGLVANEALRFPYFPAYFQLLFAAALFVDATLAQWLANWPNVVILMGLMGISQLAWKHSGWGAGAWFLYMSSPAIKHTFGFAYVDAGLAATCTGAAFAAVLWLRRVEERDGSRWLALAGVFAGLAGGIKLHGLVFGAMLGCCVVIAIIILRRPIRNVFVYGLPCLALSLFWYVRSYWLTGDPFHPVGGPVFGYFLWTAEDLAAQVAEQASHGVPKEWGYFVGSLISVKVEYFFLALLWPASLLWRRDGQRGWLLLCGLAWLGTMFWFWVSQVDRYLLPVAPMAALLCAVVVREMVYVFRLPGFIRASLRSHVLASVSLLSVGVVVGNAVREWAARPDFAFQRSQHPEIAMLDYAAMHGDQYGKRLLNFGYENAYFYYSGQLIGDWFGRAAFPKIADCREGCKMKPPDEVEKIMMDLDVRLLLIHSEKFPFDEASYSKRLHLLAKNGPAYLYAAPR